MPEKKTKKTKKSKSWADDVNLGSGAAAKAKKILRDRGTTINERLKQYGA